MQKKKNTINATFITVTSVLILFNILIMMNSYNNVVHSFLFAFLFIIASGSLFYALLMKINSDEDKHKATKAILKRDNRIKELYYIDQLTGLNNKLKLLKDGESFIRENPSKPLTVIIMDIKDFQTFNSMRGTNEGDKLLKIIASVLRKCGEGYDYFTCGKVGSDDFAVILSGSKDIGVGFYNKFNEVLSKDLTIYGIEDEILFTVGAATYPHNSNSINSLYTKAASTLKIARENSNIGLNFYDDKIIKILIERRITENKLRNCLMNSEFELYYQPKVDLATEKVIGREALIRWIDDTNGIIPPSEFIPIAEESGLITEIDEWVINKACHQNSLWQSRNIGEPVQVSINISAQELYNNNLVQKISSVLNITGLDPQYLDIEITETMAMIDIKDSIQTMKELKKIGVTMSIDDFGTGYSSLAYLRELPIDILKIDKSFIDDIEISSKSVDIVRYIIGLAKSLGLKIVAEGIETRGQFEILKKLGCDYGQGYYFGRPVPADIIEFECCSRDFQRREIQ